jgi:hypothetical protein
VPDVTQYVTGAAAQNLDSNGHFALSQPPHPDGRPIIDADRAKELAMAFVRTWAPWLRRGLEKDRDGPINFAALKPDARVYFAEAPYSPFPEGFHPAFVRGHGSYFVVTLKDGAEPVMVVSVAAHTTEIKIDSRGELEPEVFGGNEFVATAIARVENVGWGYRPTNPEQAVDRVGRATGARTAEVPHLIHVHAFMSPAPSRWRLELDRPVNVRTRAAGHARNGIRTIYVGPQNRLYVAAAEQPSESTFEALLFPEASGQPRTAMVTLRLLRPTVFEEVTAPEVR